MAVRKNYEVEVKAVNGSEDLGSVECYADDVNQWVFVGIENKDVDHYVSLPLSIDEAKDLIDALKSAINDAKLNRP